VENNMNERIQDLAEHCDFYVGNEHYDKSHEEQQRLFMEKFAELIVQECGVALSPVLRDMVSRGQAFDLIKKHFGVEE
jgi:hypothetical protein